MLKKTKNVHMLILRLFSYITAIISFKTIFIFKAKFQEKFSNYINK